MVSIGLRKLQRWGWLLRYWALDKYPREAAVLAMVMLCVMLAIGTVRALREPAPGEPAQAFWWYIAILLIAIVIAYALAPKLQPPEPQEGSTPETKDGKQLVRVFGSVWIDDAAVAGWRNNAPEPIRRRGGKK